MPVYDRLVDYVGGLAALNVGDTQGFREGFTKKGRETRRIREEAFSGQAALQKKLNDYWMGLPSENLPAAVENARNLLDLERGKYGFKQEKKTTKAAEGPVFQRFMQKYFGLSEQDRITPGLVATMSAARDTMEREQLGREGLAVTEREGAASRTLQEKLGVMSNVGQLVPWEPGLAGGLLINKFLEMAGIPQTVGPGGKTPYQEFKEKYGAQPSGQTPRRSIEQGVAENIFKRAFDQLSPQPPTGSSWLDRLGAWLGGMSGQQGAPVLGPPYTLPAQLGPSYTPPAQPGQTAFGQSSPVTKFLEYMRTGFGEGDRRTAFGKQSIVSPREKPSGPRLGPPYIPPGSNIEEIIRWITEQGVGAPIPADTSQEELNEALRLMQLMGGTR